MTRRTVAAAVPVTPIAALLALTERGFLDGGDEGFGGAVGAEEVLLQQFFGGDGFVGEFFVFGESADEGEDGGDVEFRGGADCGGWVRGHGDSGLAALRVTGTHQVGVRHGFAAHKLRGTPTHSPPTHHSAPPPPPHPPPRPRLSRIHAARVRRFGVGDFDSSGSVTS